MMLAAAAAITTSRETAEESMEISEPTDSLTQEGVLCYCNVVREF